MILGLDAYDYACGRHILLFMLVACPIILFCNRGWNFRLLAKIQRYLLYSFLHSGIFGSKIEPVLIRQANGEDTQD